MGPSIVRAEPKSAGARRAMVDNQIRTFDVTDQRVQAAFEAIPRELFIPDHLAELAYSDSGLTTSVAGASRYLVAPMVLARMFQGLELSPTDNVLIVAPGTGYAAAIAAELCQSVVAVEAEPAFGTAMDNNLQVLRLTNCSPVIGALRSGWPQGHPYSAALVCGAVETNLDGLLGQVAPGGRLVAILTASHEATRRSGKVVRFDRIGSDISSRVLFDATAPVLDDFRLEPAFAF